MSGFKPLLLAVAATTLFAVAGPAFAATPAKAFECPATQAQAEALLSQLKQQGAEVTDEYGTRTRVFDATGRTVFGLPVFKLEIIVDKDERYDYVAFQAKTQQPFETARAAMFRVTGQADCDNRAEDRGKVCKVNGPGYGAVSIMQYVERSNVGGINVGCQYATAKARRTPHG